MLTMSRYIMFTLKDKIMLHLKDVENNVTEKLHIV